MVLEKAANRIHFFNILIKFDPAPPLSWSFSLISVHLSILFFILLFFLFFFLSQFLLHTSSSLNLTLLSSFFSLPFSSSLWILLISSLYLLFLSVNSLNLFSPSLFFPVNSLSLYSFSRFVFLFKVYQPKVLFL